MASTISQTGFPEGPFRGRSRPRSSRTAPVGIIVLALLGILFLGLILPSFPVVSLGLMLGGAIYLFVLRRPHLAAYGLLASIPLYSFIVLPITNYGLKLRTAALLFCVAIWAGHVLLNRSRETLIDPWRDRRMRWAAFFVVVILASALSNLAGAGEWLSMGLSEQLTACGIFFVVPALLRDREKLEAGTRIFLGLGAVVGLMGIVEILMTRNIYLIVYGRVPEALLRTNPAMHARLSGVEGDATWHGLNAACYAALVLPFLAGARRRLVRWALALLLLVFVLNVIGTASRAAVGCMVAAVCVFVMLEGGRFRVPIIAGTVVAVLVMTVTIITIVPDFNLEHHLTKNDYTDNFRLANLQIATRMWADHPFLGVGSSGWRARYFDYTTTDSYRNKPYDVHNAWMDATVSYGALGLVAWTGLLIVHLLGLYRVWRHTSDRKLRLLAAGLIAMLTAYAIFATTSNGLTQRVFWVQLSLGAMLTVCARKAESGVRTTG